MHECLLATIIGDVHPVPTMLQIYLLQYLLVRYILRALTHGQTWWLGEPILFKLRYYVVVQTTFVYIVNLAASQ